MAKNESKFYKKLEEIFIGAPIKGDSGYVNLLSIKQNYYKKSISSLKNKIDNDSIVNGSFKEELYDKLYSFFEKYFSESGSVYFVKSNNWQQVYEKIYTDNKDVIMFWKTNMLYYVKSDILFNDLYIKVEDENNNYDFYFDVGNLKQKQNNEKRDIIYSFSSKKKVLIDNKQIEAYCFSVSYSERGKKNNIQFLSSETHINEEILLKAFKMFEKQSEVDFFINKNAHEFLNQQLSIYINQILSNDNNVFNQERLSQLKSIKHYAELLIDFIAQFEDELVRIWNKPKFVLNSDYVISLKSLSKSVIDDDYKKIYKEIRKIYDDVEDFKNDIIFTIRDIYKQPLSKIYVNNVQLINDTFNLSYIKVFDKEEEAKDYAKRVGKNIVTEKVYDRDELINGFKVEYEQNNLIYEIPFEKCYIDTKYCTREFKNEIISALCKNNKLDELINGYLIKSDNYQFLNTANKFKNKIDCVYIDPPFNAEGKFAYVDRFKDSTWLTMMNDRISLVKNKMLSDRGCMYLHLDSNCNYLARSLCDGIFHTEPNREIIWNTSPSPSGFKAKAQNWIRQHDTIFFYSNEQNEFNKMWITKERPDNLGWLDIFKNDDESLYTYKYNSDDELVAFPINRVETIAIGDVWNDIYSMMYSQNMTRENWGEDNTQKPENLARRIIQSSSNQYDFVMDFYAGTGTTLAAAHKLNRKWVGVEMAEYVDRIILKRLKTVLFGDYRTKLSEDLQWSGGGIFKYYELEQYENTLDKCVYDSQQLSLFDYSNKFNKYIFFADKKLTDFIDVDNKKIMLDFDKLYSNIDIPETISNLLGLPIVYYNDDEVILDNNGTNKVYKINPSKMSENEKNDFIQLIKPLIWWGE